MTQAVILHTIQDVEHCLQQDFHQGARLFSTNVHVVYYLKYHFGMECYDLCSYIDPQEIRRTQAAALQAVKLLLSELDRQIAPELNGQFKLSMQYFTPLYALTASRQLFLYTLLKHSLGRLLAECPFSSILIYDGESGPLKSSLQLFLSQMFPKTRFHLVRYQHTKRRDKTTTRGLRLGDIPELLIREKTSECNFRKKWFKQQGQTKNNLLVFEPLDKLSFLARETGEAGVYLYNPWTDPIIRSVFDYELNLNVMPAVSSLDSVRLVAEDMRELLLLVYEDIKKEFCRNFVQYLQVVHAFRTMEERNPVSDAYWEIPPFQGAGALLLEYCLTHKAMRVTGVQSQATFFAGQTITPYFPLPVLDRCHRYVTQGITPEEVKSVYSGITGKAEIISLCAGDTAKPTGLHKNRKTADVAFYLTPASSFLQTGQVATNTADQEAILNFLNECQGKEIHVVTYAMPSMENCAMLSLLKRLKNIRLIKDATQDNYLVKYAPKLILMDSPMPYLQNVLGEDISVILRQDTTVVFGKTAEELLKKRVYYVEGSDETKQLLQLHFEELLPKKSDAGYVNEFCRQTDLPTLRQYIRA